MAKTKKVRIRAFIPELPSSHAYQDADGRGGTLAVAIGRAVDELLKLPHVKGRKLTSLRLTIVVMGVGETAKSLSEECCLTGDHAKNK